MAAKYDYPSIVSQDRLPGKSWASKGRYEVEEIRLDEPRKIVSKRTKQIGILGGFPL